MMFYIMCFLNFSSTICFPERFHHRLGKIICIEYHFTIRISGCTTDDLDQWCCRTQKSFFIRIQYGQQRNFWQIQSFSQQIDTYDDIDNSRFKFFDNLPAINCGYFTMEIERFISFWYKKCCYLFWWFFSKSKKQNSASFCYMPIHFCQKMFEKSWLLVLDTCSIYLEKIMHICYLHNTHYPDKNTCGSIYKKWKITIARHKNQYTFDFSMPNNISKLCRQKNEQNILSVAWLL